VCRKSMKLSWEFVDGWWNMRSVFLPFISKNQRLIRSTHSASTTSIGLNDSQHACS
jgi:hypothetical protein